MPEDALKEIALVIYCAVGERNAALEYRIEPIIPLAAVLLQLIATIFSNKIALLC